MFSPGQLAALDPDATYTLDLIDCGDGGWGWVNLDSVGIPGTAVASPYAAWAAGKGLAGADAAFDVDPDGDTIPNGIEFVIGGEPNPAHPGWNSLALLPTAEVQGESMVFAFTRAKVAAYLGPVDEFSEDLVAPWTVAADPGNATIEVIDNGATETVNCPFSQPPAPPSPANWPLNSAMDRSSISTATCPSSTVRWMTSPHSASSQAS